MAQTNRRRKGAESIRALAALLEGGVLALALGTLVLLLLAGALCSGRLEEAAALRFSPAAAALGSLAGGLWSARALGERFLPAALGAAVLGAVLWALLGTLALDGTSPAGLLRLLLAALAGGALAGILAAR